MFGLFLKTVPNQFARLKPLVQEKNVVEIKKMAHQLKPSFTMVGLPEITQNLQTLEKAAQNNEDFNIIKGLFDKTEMIFNRKIGLVEKELEKLNKW